jgi:hypothetical protein
MVGTSHLFQKLHLFEGGTECISGGTHGADGGVTRIFSCCSCLFSSPSGLLRRATCLLSFLPDLLEFFTMLLMHYSRFFSEPPKLFSLAPSSFIHHTAFLREAAVVFANPILAFGLGACPFRFEPPLPAPKIVVCHWNSPLLSTANRLITLTNRKSEPLLQMDG